MRSLAVLLLVLAVVHAPSSAAISAGETRMQRRQALEAAIVLELNRVRADRGLRALRLAPGLRAAARSHTRAMLSVGFFEHDSADGTGFSDRIRRYYRSRGWESWSVGETLLASQGREIAASAIVSAWLRSPPHREIVLAPSWRDVGVGALYAASAPPGLGGGEAIVVTADFGQRSGRPAGA
jgi:uncharacterized protein YkwD